MKLYPSIQKLVDRLRPKRAAHDPGSAKLWLDFKAAEEVFRCCRAVRTVKDMGLNEMWCFWNGRKKKVAEINYCPECGRKL